MSMSAGEYDPGWYGEWERETYIENVRKAQERINEQRRALRHNVPASWETGQDRLIPWRVEAKRVFDMLTSNCKEG